MKKPQIVLALLAGVGMFLPTVSVSAYNQSVTSIVPNQSAPKLKEETPLAPPSVNNGMQLSDLVNNNANQSNNGDNINK